jgi:hypothetical protein
MRAPSDFSDSAQETVDEDDRKGFHFGIGGMLGLSWQLLSSGNYGYVAPGLGNNLEAHFQWTFGLIGVRISPSLGLNLGSRFGISLGALSQVQFNFSRLYALGAGLHLGFEIMDGRGFGMFGPSISPALIRLGDRGQHCLEARFTLPYLPYGVALPTVLVGYSFFF